MRRVLRRHRLGYNTWVARKTPRRTLVVLRKTESPSGPHPTNSERCPRDVEARGRSHLLHKWVHLEDCTAHRCDSVQLAVRVDTKTVPGGRGQQEGDGAARQLQLD